MSARIAVFASGGGSNLQALIDHFRDRAAADVALVISDRRDARALERAAAAGIPAHHIPVRDRPPAAVAADTLDALSAARADVIALAGYLRLVPTDVIRSYAHRIVNVHPSLLPAFGGKGMYGARVHRTVLESGCRVTGATVHLVDERYDEGRILAQWPVPVRPDDTAEALAARVLRIEHALYPVAVEWLVTRGPAGTGVGGAFRLEQTEEPDRDGIRRMFDWTDGE